MQSKHAPPDLVVLAANNLPGLARALAVSAGTKRTSVIPFQPSPRETKHMNINAEWFHPPQKKIVIKKKHSTTYGWLNITQQQPGPKIQLLKGSTGCGSCGCGSGSDSATFKPSNTLKEAQATTSKQLVEVVYQGTRKHQGRPQLLNGPRFAQVIIHHHEQQINSKCLSGRLIGKVAACPGLPFPAPRPEE